LHCSDGLDNDGDALVDFPDDPSCRKRSDTSETDQCRDGLDNDGDTLVDLADPGCVDAASNNESPQCDDSLDNDSDKLVDFPADSNCASASDDDESAPPQCSDGLDNDGDGRIDYGTDPSNDPGCESPWDDGEATHPQPAACGLLGIEPLLLAPLTVRRRRRALAAPRALLALAPREA
jgi:hypothetical protein